MEIDVEKCFHFIQEKAKDHSEAKGEVIRLESKLKAVKGALMDASDSTSIALKEADAYRSLEYMECANELAKAVTTDAYLALMIKTAFAKLEWAKVEAYQIRNELKNIDMVRG